MDLQNLRSFIEHQKMLLEVEKTALLSRRRTPMQEDALVPKDDIAKNADTSTKNLIFSTGDIFAERINSLNSFKNQVCSKSEGCEDFNSSSNEQLLYGCKELNEESVLVKENSDQCPSSKTPINCPPKGTSCAVLEATEKDEEDGVQVQECSLNSPVAKDLIQQTVFDRKVEVERLQEKFSAASFWDGFGQSATGKKCKTNDQDTMVRVGEFSPSNPDLQAPGKALLGLGEYEVRRRQLLEKKKKELKEYLSLARNNLQKTNHFQQPSLKSHYGSPNPVLDSNSSKEDGIHTDISSCVDVATQTDLWLVQPCEPEISLKPTAPLLSPMEPSLQPLSPRDKHNMELRHHCTPCFVPRTHASQTMEQLPDARLRQLKLQEELRCQIEEKRRLEAERREQERLEEEALQRRVAEQQARLQAEYEREEKLKRERELQKQQQIEEFQRRQEELRAESEALKQEGRRQKFEAAESSCKKYGQQQMSDPSKGLKNAHLPLPEPAPLSVLKSSSPSLRSPRTNTETSKHSEKSFSGEPVSPRALIKVLEGPTLPKRSPRLEDSLPIPLMPVVHTHASSQQSHMSTRRSPLVSPHLSPRRSPRRSPSRFIADQDWTNSSALPHLRSHPSEALQNLEERWKVPAVQKNLCVRGKRDVQNGSTGSVLTQLGAFRRQLQMEHMRMEEKVRERHQPVQYHQQHFQQHHPGQSNLKF